MRKHLNRFCASPEGARALINAWRENCLEEKVRDMNVAYGEPAEQIELYLTIDIEAVVRCLNGCELHLFSMPRNLMHSWREKPLGVAFNKYAALWRSKRHGCETSAPR
jgi:hypothetical protein